MERHHDYGLLRWLRPPAHADCARTARRGPAGLHQRSHRAARPGIQPADRPDDEPVPLRRPCAAPDWRDTHLARRIRSAAPPDQWQRIQQPARRHHLRQRFRPGRHDQFPPGYSKPLQRRHGRSASRLSQLGHAVLHRRQLACSTGARTQLRVAVSARHQPRGGQPPQHRSVWLQLPQPRSALRLRIPVAGEVGRTSRRVRVALRRDLSRHFPAGAL